MGSRLEGSTRRPCSKPTPPMPLMIGCPKVGVDGDVPKLNVASHAPAEQSASAMKIRKVRRPDWEAEFFFIVG